MPRGSPAVREALEGLCRDYWYPLYAFVRRRGYDRDEAADVVQGLFTDLLARRNLVAVNSARGRFRSYLMAACCHYLANCREHDRAQKRGGGRDPISIDVIRAEGLFVCEPYHDLTAERLFERQWAMTLLDRALALLKEEFKLAGQETLFDRLNLALSGAYEAPKYRVRGAWSWE